MVNVELAELHEGVPAAEYVYPVNGFTTIAPVVGHVMDTTCCSCGVPESMTAKFVVAAVSARPVTVKDDPVIVIVAPVWPEVAKTEYPGVPPVMVNVEDLPTQVLLV